MSAKQGPVLETKPANTASAAGGKFMNRPRLTKITVTAKPGNQPENMAHSPTRIAAAMDENVHQKIQRSSFGVPWTP